MFALNVIRINEYKTDVLHKVFIKYSFFLSKSDNNYNRFLIQNLKYYIRFWSNDNLQSYSYKIFSYSNVDFI